MAKKLKSFEFTGRRGNRKYPWEEWTNGEVWEVTAFKDFDCSTGSFAQAAYQQARRMGKKVRVFMKNEAEHPKVVFQFYDEIEVAK